MKKRVLYYDVLNILATISVVAMHINGMVHLYSDTVAWKQALVAEVVCFWAVPVFLMLSGATLMGYRERYTTKEFFKKRMLRTLFPFIIWSLVCMVGYGFDIASLGFRGIINKVIFCEFETTYWFFPVLFSIYLAVPVISLLKDNRKILWYMVGCAFMLYSVLPLALSWIGIGWNMNFQMPVVAGYLMFPILGYLLATQDFKKTQRIVFYIAGVLCSVFRYAAVLALSKPEGALNKKYFDNLGFYCVLLAVAVFLFVKNSNLVKKLENNKKIAAVLKTVSGCSFGIYLIHRLFMNHILWRIIERDGLAWRTVGILITYVASFAIVYVIRKIPLVKKIVP